MCLYFFIIKVRGVAKQIQTREMLAYLRARELKYRPLHSCNKYAHYTSSYLFNNVLAWVPNTSSSSLLAFVLWVPDYNGNTFPYKCSVSLAHHSSSTHKTFIKCLLFVRCWEYDSLLVQDLYLWNFHSNGGRSSIKK